MTSLLPTPVILMPNPSDRSVAVLLATHNGDRWIEEQLSTIFGQVDVQVRVIASDDLSADGTADILERWAREKDLTVLSRGRRFGNANRNFLHLIRSATVYGADYVALSDQDDIWIDSKLSNAVKILQERGAKAYSSDVVAFWPDGRKRHIRKSDRQRDLDHIFESPGPGCTFVFPVAAFLELQAWVQSQGPTLDEVKVHDWLIYAWARQSGWVWAIDDNAGVLYRQHSENEIGANSGIIAVSRRVRALRSGAYRSDVLKIARAVGHDSDDLRRLDRFHALDRLMLMLVSRRFRRRLQDALALGVSFAVMKRYD